MSTATRAFVRGVTAASTAAGSRFSVRRSTSAKTGVAPPKMKQFALEANEIGDVIASSPGPSPAMCASRWRPAVPLETAATYGAPMRSASSSSKRSIVGPSESRPERSTSRTSSSSRSSNSGRASGISRTDVPGRPPLTAGGAGLRGGLTSLAAGCGARVACTHNLCCPARRALASFASAAPGTPEGRCSSLGGRGRGVLEPLGPALAAAARGIQVVLLDLERDRPDADLDVIDRPQRRHLGGRPGHERLVGEVEVRADQRLLVHAVAEVLRDLDHGVARDSRQDRGREIGREELAVLDEEDVLARAVGDEPVAGQQDRL